MGRLAGKVALISGGARGQGAAETQLFVREGAAVVFGDVLDDDGKKVEAEIRVSGGQVTYVHLNVTREGDWRAAVATAVQTYGKLDVLVNNAGILFRSKIEETSEADWDRIMAVNVKGVFLGTKCAIPAMRQAGGGSIINISSTAGLVGSPGETAAYSATKGAVRLFTKSTAIQHAKDKIRCNSVHPGPIATDMIKDVLENRASWEPDHPGHRRGRRRPHDSQPGRRADHPQWRAGRRVRRRRRNSAAGRRLRPRRGGKALAGPLAYNRVGGVGMQIRLTRDLEDRGRAAPGSMTVDTFLSRLPAVPRELRGEPVVGAFVQAFATAQ